MASENFNPLSLSGFRSLFAAQLLGAFNDNFYRMVISLTAIEAAGPRHGGYYLTMASVALVLPYLLFSGWAGQVADRIHKRRVLIASKGAEVVLMIIGMGALMSRSVELQIALLFLLGIQATFFCPAKYGILPEMFGSSSLQRANGLLEMSRFVAVIVGTVSGGLALSFWHSNPMTIGTVMVVIAMCGFAATLMIPKWGQRSAPGITTPSTAHEIVAGTKRIFRNRGLMMAVLGATFFEGLGALSLPTIVLVGEQSLNLGEIRTSLLPASVGVGLALGSYLAGRLSRGRIETGMVPVGLMGVGIGMASIHVASVSYLALASVLVVTGAFGGLVIVPLNATIQRRAGNKERGRIIATNVFFNMISVLAMSGAPWLLFDQIGIAPESVLVGTGTTTLAGTIILIARSRKVLLETLNWLRGFSPRLLGLASTVPALTMALTLTLALVCPRAEASTIEAPHLNLYTIEHALFGDIGTLRQEIRTDGNSVQVKSQLSIRIQVFGSVTLRAIEALCEETWLETRLVSYRCRTDDDGEITEILGHVENQNFILVGPTGKSEGPAEIHPLSPWSINFTEARSIIALGSGKAETVRITCDGMRQIEVAARTIHARHFVATGDEDFELWYDDNDVPVKFRLTAGGAEITFELQTMSKN